MDWLASFLGIPYWGWLLVVSVFIFLIIVILQDMLKERRAKEKIEQWKTFSIFLVEVISGAVDELEIEDPELRKKVAALEEMANNLKD